MNREEWQKRQEQWRRFAEWVPPISAAELDTRLRWLSDAVELARELGLPDEEPFDSPEVRRRRRRIRRALADVHA